ncbi:MAG: hypothetical protein PSV40_17595 [Polaromonas sp.]|uniref:hypothetical protein n=1 Tax=Polaromonas sp. TaxID=1869339 RepID=UPI002487011A|nr:hypothetical protein [Polaromonas sp.]MDI1270900.1 hypothetical protein [Polaromonas sp.]
MDEPAYHASRRTLNLSPCVFERALLAGCAQCELASRHALAEREVVACSLEVARINCTTLESLFRERATFALRLPRPGVPLVHAKAMQLQCGGLRGLQAAVAAPTADVHAMVQKAKRNDASLLELPWGEIVASMMAWQPRRRAQTPKP